MSNLLADSDRISLFKKFLLQLPSKYDFEYCEAASIELRRLLNFSASNDGEFMKYLLFTYNTVQTGSCSCDVPLPQTWPHVLVPERYPHLDNPSIYHQRSKIRDLCHPNRTCGVKFVRGEPIYRCNTCGNDDSSGICVNCFDESQHEGHDFSLVICQRDNGGICDCGNDEAWGSKFGCHLKDVEEVDESMVPEALKESLLRTFEASLDYVVDVMSNTYCTLRPVRDREDILSDAFNCALEEHMYSGTDWPSPVSYLILYDDPTKQYREAVDRIQLATDKQQEFARMVADEVNSNGRAKVIKSSDLEYLLEKKKILQATGFPCSIKNAREIFREDMCLEILEWMAEVSVGEIHGNYNIARDLLTKAFCRPWGAGIKPLSKEDSKFPGSLQKNNIPNIRHQFKKYPEEHQRSQAWKLLPQVWDIDELSANDCHYGLDFAFLDEHDGEFHGSRFQHLLYLDMRLWKALKRILHGLFNQVLPSNQKYKAVVCAQYVDIYPTILELYFLHDRESELNCMSSLTAQIFSCASNATMIVKHGDITRLLALGYGFITQERAIRPCDVTFTPLSKYYGAKNRRLSQLFYDVCCILRKSEDIEMITSDSFFHQLCDLLVLFQGRPLVKREIHEHVEYESNEYSVFFNMYTIMSTISELAAKNMKRLPKLRTDHLIKLIAERLFHGSHRYELGASGTLRKPVNDVQAFNMRKVQTLDGDTRMTMFKVHQDFVSFLHPLHAFLSWAIQYSTTGPETFYPSVDGFNFDKFDMKEIILEYPLRTLVLLSQIKSGMWIRNGQGLKTQLLMYTGPRMRESGYMRDLQLIQLSACLYDPNFIFFSFMNRWSLTSWVVENFGYFDDYPSDCLGKMVTEFMLFLLHMLTETEHLDDPVNLSYLKIKRLLIHTLCFDSMTYPQICSAVPDFVHKDKLFESILNELTTFSGDIDERMGHYKLKDEYFDEIEPYYICYGTNEYEKADIVLRERMAKKLDLKPEETYIKPVIKKISSPVYKSLFQFTSMKLFTQFLRSTLKYIDREGPDMTTLMLNLTLHLIHVAIEGQELTYALKFAENIWSEFVADHNEPFFYESVGSLLYKLLANEVFVAFHPKLRAIFLSLKSKSNLYDSYLSEQVRNYDPTLLLDENLSLKGTSDESDFDKKKRLAKERRDKIMARFKKQQTKFSKNNVDAAQEAQDGSNQTITEDLMDVDSQDSHWKYPEECCILCQMPAEGDDVFGVLANISKNLISRNVPFDSKYWTLKSFQVEQMDSEVSVDRSNETLMSQFFDKSHDINVIGPSFPNSSLHRKIPTFSSCGHGMHYKCYQEFLKSAKDKQIQITRTVHENFEVNEVVCPLCKSLGNLFMPILWDCNRNRLKDFVACNWGNDLRQLSTVKYSDTELQGKTVTELALYVRSTVLPRFVDDISSFDPPKPLEDSLRNAVGNIKEFLKPMLSYQLPGLLGGTISQVEIANRNSHHESGLVSNLVSNHCLTALRVLSEFNSTWLSYQTIQESDPSHKLVSGISYIAESIAKLELLFSPDMFQSIEEVDFFEYVVSCVKIPGISMNTVYRLGYIYEFLKVTASLLANITEHAYKKSPALFRMNSINVKNPSSHQNLKLLLKLLRDNHPKFDNLPDVLFDHETYGPMMLSLITRAMTPFLRKLCIWAVGINTDYSETGYEDFSLEDGYCESSRLCRLLQLPNIEEIIELFLDRSTFESEKFSQFVQYVTTTDNDLTFGGIAFPGVYELVHLPHRLDDIFTKLIHRHPNFCSIRFKNPAVCLLCGDIMNLQKQTVNGKLGQCSDHTANGCAHGIGIFLLPEQNSLLLTHRGNGSFHTIPYVNRHGGHDDSDSKTATALRLSEKQYGHLIKQMWLLNDLPNYITRKLDGILDNGGWESL
ncbi:hypothetical protein WICPIJ_009872 [Wickerhamomyces pijperi]|uniref:E3 ubiquitin-protein ligase n=1 Tax=Wickerhamomyces pijperi TaxID=599730 RepID=A0A9P8PJC9_WICPI|nr:hypothetical protein WICPIJ_009872 [Wickerhamomyces pijperi]